MIHANSPAHNYGEEPQLARNRLAEAGERRAVGSGMLLVVFFDCYVFEVLGFKDLTAIETFDVLDAVTPGDDLGTVVLTSGLHNARLRIYSNEAETLVKGLPDIFFSM